MKILKLPIGQLMNVLVKTEVPLNLQVKVSEPSTLWGTPNHISWHECRVLTLSSGSHRTTGTQMSRGLLKYFSLRSLEADNSLKAGYPTVTGCVYSNCSQEDVGKKRQQGSRVTLQLKKKDGLNSILQVHFFPL